MFSVSLVRVFTHAQDGFEAQLTSDTRCRTINKVSLYV